MEENLNKKILFIINGLGYGGAETQLVRLSLALINRGYEITLLTLTNDLALQNQLDQRVKHYNIPLQKRFSVFSAIKKILKTIKQEQPNVIHAHLFQANILSRLIKVFNKNIRVINTTHGSYLLNIRNYNPYKIYRFTQKWVDYHTAVSQEVLDLLINKKSIKKNKSSYIPNGLFVKKYTTKQNKNNTFKWLAIGRFHPVKQYSTLIKAISILRKNNNNFVLNIAGDGEERIKLEKLITKNKLEKHVILLGLIDNIPQLLTKFTGFVISSSSEGLPMVLLEAMSASLPIVSTNVGEIGTIINKSNGGIIILKKDEITLANAMSKMMNYSKEKQIKLGVNNRKFAEEHYDIEKLVKTWESIYFKLKK